MSRTVGFPYFGHDGAVEPVSVLDALSAVAELGAVAGLYLLTAARSPRAPRWAGLAAVALVAAVVGLPLAPSDHVHAEEAHDAPAAVPAHVHHHH
jgi:hypothetical protein